LVRPDAKGNWIEPGDPEFDGLKALISERTKKAKTERTVDAIFKAYTNGINTARDPWVYGEDEASIREKIEYFLDVYSQHKKGQKYSKKIKWSRNLKKKQTSGLSDGPLGEEFINVNYRPFECRLLYNSKLLIDEPGLAPSLYPAREPNPSITITDTSSRAMWPPFASPIPIDFHFGSTSDGYKAIPRYRFTKDGERVDNITNWAVKEFDSQYGKKARVTKDAIFGYCYAVLHDPVYREKYALNLKREFPRIPFYDDFAQWAGWGQQLLDLHIGYEKAKPFTFTRIDTPNPKRAKGSHPKPKLKSEPDKGLVLVDEDTQLTGIPRGAWDYRLGNRSAIDWVLDQHKEKTPRDPTVREKFNTYRFANYKESMIDLLARVITVSLETVKITEAMRALERGANA